MFKQFLIVSICLFAGPLFGQVQVKIDDKRYEEKDLITVEVTNAGDDVRIKIFDSQFNNVTCFQLVSPDASQKLYHWQALSNGRYMVEASDATGDAIQIVVVGDGKKPDNPPDDEPEKPDDPIPTPNLEGLPLEIYTISMKVKSPNRASEAKRTASMFRAVISQAAGVKMSPQKINDATTQLIANGFNEAELEAWKEWRQQLKEIILRDFGRSSAEELLAGWEQIAQGLEAVR